MREEAVAAGMLPASPEGWSFFLDVDGTLVDIAPTPDAVVVPPALPAVLERLAVAAGGALALVSGRTIAALDALFAPVRLAAAGVHGAEVRLPGGMRRLLVEADIGPARQRLRALAARHPELIVEDKGVALAVHFRSAPRLASTVEAAVAEAVAGNDALRVQPGKMVFEVAPRGADKGSALAFLMEQPPFRGRRPVALGDDLTDESMLAAARKLGGVAVSVGRPLPSAMVTLDSPRAARDWLTHQL